MNTMNIRPAFQYRFLDTLKGVGIFYAIMAVLMAGISCLVFYAVSKGGKVSVSFFAFEFAAAITLFVMGITTIREDMRLMLQIGIGRRTIFVTELLVALSVSLLLAIAGELLIAVGQVVITSRSEFFITETPFLYNTLFFVTMNLDKWNSLDPETQRAIETVNAKFFEEVAIGLWDKQNEAALKWATEQNGMQVIDLTPAETELWINRVKPIQDEFVNNLNQQGLNGQEALDTVKQLADKYNQLY
jgi:hypothetical protein